MPETPLEFEWEGDKAQRTIKRHDVTFEEAAGAFDDEFAYIFEDETHSLDEPRELLIGYSKRNRLLLIVFTQRGSLVRLISARRVDGKERKLYEQAKRF